MHPFSAYLARFDRKLLTKYSHFVAWYVQDDGTDVESLLSHQKYQHGQIQCY